MVLGERGLERCQGSAGRLNRSPGDDDEEDFVDGDFVDDDFVEDDFVDNDFVEDDFFDDDFFDGDFVDDDFAEDDDGVICGCCSSLDQSPCDEDDDDDDGSVKSLMKKITFVNRVMMMVVVPYDKADPYPSTDISTC